MQRVGRKQGKAGAKALPQGSPDQQKVALRQASSIHKLWGVFKRVLNKENSGKILAISLIDGFLLCHLSIMKTVAVRKIMMWAGVTGG